MHTQRCQSIYIVVICLIHTILINTNQFTYTIMIIIHYATGQLNGIINTGNCYSGR